MLELPCSPQSKSLHSYHQSCFFHSNSKRNVLSLSLSTVQTGILHRDKSLPLSSKRNSPSSKGWVVKTPLPMRKHHLICLIRGSLIWLNFFNYHVIFVKPVYTCVLCAGKTLSHTFVCIHKFNSQARLIHWRLDVYHCIVNGSYSLLPLVHSCENISFKTWFISIQHYKVNQLKTLDD